MRQLYFLVVFAFYFLGITQAQPVQRDTSYYPNLRIWSSLYPTLLNNYVEQPDLDKLTRTGIDAMLNKLDPYTYFMPRSEAEARQRELKPKFGGTGLIIRNVDKDIVITGVRQGFAGDRAGIRPTDIILSVNGQSATGKLSAEVSELLRGDPGSKVMVVIKRQGAAQNLTYTFTREIINYTNVPYYAVIGDHIGYIKTNGMTDRVTEEVLAALLDLKKDPALNGIILDLRDNGGGYRREAEGIANLFLEKGKMIVRVKGRREDTSYYTVKAPVDTNIPLVVLIGSVTASSAEILSGALQDYDRAVFIGQRSFGKGLIQLIYDLGNGNQVQVTRAFYYTPSGRCIQARTYKDGVTQLIPDSLGQTFKTKNGRTIKGSGGISPDIVTEDMILPLKAAAAYNKNLFYKFAAAYHAKHPTIPSPPDFSITDNDYMEFLDLLAREKLSTAIPAEVKLDEWKAQAIQDGRWKSIEQSYITFRSAIEADADREMANRKLLIKSLLDQEIVGLYYYEKGKVESSLNYDPTLDQAKALLADNAKYRRILEGK